MPAQPRGQGRREAVIDRSVLEDLIFRRAPMRRYPKTARYSLTSGSNMEGIRSPGWICS
jgi:hypothetical protein